MTKTTPAKSSPPIANKALLDTVSTSIFRITPQVHDNDFQHYTIKKHQLAKLNIYVSESDPFTAHRSKENIIDDPTFDFLILTQLEGTSTFKQEEASFSVEPGALAVVPGGLPYSLDFPEKSKRLFLRIPHQVFHERVLGRKSCEFGARIYKGDGLVKIVIDLLKSLAEESGTLSETEQYTVAESALELIGAVFRSQAGLDANKQGSVQSARLCKVLSYLEENFTDHALTPSKVASANAVSMRHLHNLFQHSGITVCKWIWERRLKAARDELLDPGSAKKSIIEIAYDKGFNDSAHFSRTFKERFGISPSLLRKKAQTETPQDTAQAANN